MQSDHLPLCTIAGSDPTGGAGVQGDLRTFAAHGAWGTAVVTAVTAQDRQRVSAVHPVPAEVVKAQLDAVLETLPPRGCKTGMLWSAATIHVVAGALSGTGIPLVVDPVLVATSGHSLADEEVVDALPGDWSGVTSRAGWGTWTVLRRDAAQGER